MLAKPQIIISCVTLFWSVLAVSAPSDRGESSQQFKTANVALPEIMCAPLQACDITLPKGEFVKGLYFGDSLRWMHEVAESGEGELKQAHIILKPQQENLRTNLIITSSKSTYHIKLISVELPRNYQFEFLKKEEHKKNDEVLVDQSATPREEGLIDLSKLDFHYIVKYPFLSHKFMGGRLEQIFNDGKHVYIKIPKKWLNRELPVLFVENDGALVLANYRIKKDYYMVDHLFQKAVFAFNVGKKQKRLEITYQG